MGEEAASTDGTAADASANTAAAATPVAALDLAGERESPGAPRSSLSASERLSRAEAAIDQQALALTRLQAAAEVRKVAAWRGRGERWGD